jgi:hypothetical protein
MEQMEPQMDLTRETDAEPRRICRCCCSQAKVARQNRTRGGGPERNSKASMVELGSSSCKKLKLPLKTAENRLQFTLKKEEALNLCG